MFKKFVLATAISSFIFSACEQEDPIIPNEEELITTVVYTLTPEIGGATISLQFSDLDGDGGNDPIITGGTIDANTIYTGVLELSDQSGQTPEDITEEVSKEAVDHQFFFQSSDTSLVVTYNDQDSDGNPVGLQTNLTTGDSTDAVLTIILRHKPNKSESGVSSGDITNAGGETDIEVAFPINVR